MASPGKTVLANCLARLEQSDARELAGPSANWADSALAATILGNAPCLATIIRCHRRKLLAAHSAILANGTWGIAMNLPPHPSYALRICRAGFRVPAIAARLETGRDGLRNHAKVSHSRFFPNQHCAKSARIISATSFAFLPSRKSTAGWRSSRTVSRDSAHRKAGAERVHLLGIRRRNVP